MSMHFKQIAVEITLRDKRKIEKCPRIKSSTYRQNTIALAVLRQCPEAMVIEAPAFWNNQQTC